jgi:hypothetical protein
VCITFSLLALLFFCVFLYVSGILSLDCEERRWGGYQKRGVERSEKKRREMYGLYSGCCLIPGVVLVNMCCLVYTYFRIY